MEIEGPTDLLEWFSSVSPEIESIEKMLAVELTNEIMFLQSHLAHLAVMQGSLSRLLADATSLLEYAEQQQLIEKKEDQTDLDRRKIMQAATRNERRVVNILEGFSKALRNKMITTMSLKKVLAGEVVSQYDG